METKDLFAYTPDPDLKVERESGIRLMCAGFQSHENGLPEWFKNASDAYLLEEIPATRRIIIVIFSQGRSPKTRTISCLDFVGMTNEVIEEYFRHWFDPNAATHGRNDVAGKQGGHGNGGKCYMTQMFNQASFFHTVRGGRGNRYGVTAGSVHFGYFPNPEKGCDFAVVSPIDELEKVLSYCNCSVDVLPKAALEALNTQKGFSLFIGFDPRYYEKGIPIKPLTKSLRNHPQSLRTLELCKVYLIVDGKLVNSRRQLVPPEITPIRGAEKPRAFEMPSKLPDPETGSEISTTDGGKMGRGTLVLFTSEKSMRRQLANRHCVKFYDTDNEYLGYVPVSELDIQSTYRDRLYGACTLNALAIYKKNERERLAKSPLTRAVEHFISNQIESYAKEFEARDKQVYSKEERNEICKMNEALNKWKNQFLQERMQGIFDDNGGSGRDGSSLPSGTPLKIQLNIPFNRAGLGITMRPILKFFDDNGQRIRAVPYRFVCDDYNIATINEDLLLIQTHSYGKTFIFAETIEGDLKSNNLSLEVVHIKKIRISPTSITLPQGSRRKFDAICILDEGIEVKDVLLDWEEDDPTVTRVSSSGMTYGLRIGETKVIAWDTNCESEKATVNVITGEGKRGYPRVLVSGEDFDLDPDEHDYVRLAEDDPPVHQRVQDIDRNIWWINSVSPLARLYLDEGKNFGYKTTQWRAYHLERYIDVIVQILLRYGPSESESYYPKEWIPKWMDLESQIQAAAFDDLEKFLISGELP